MGEKQGKSAKEKAARFCSLQERSQQEVRNKLSDYQVFGDEAEEIIAELISLNFINEERFARAYVRGKFRMKHWGRIKIQRGLYQHRISDYCTRKGFEEIDGKEYIETLKRLIMKYLPGIRENNPWKVKNKVSKYLIGKGYEPSLVYDIVSQELDN